MIDLAYIAVDPAIMGGTPCIRGTRITVYAIEARIAGGEAMSAILSDYRNLTTAEIEAAVAYAARLPFVEDPDGRPWRKVSQQAAE